MERLKSHAYKHSLLYIISAVLLTLVIAAGVGNYRTTVAARKNFLTSALERQSLSELNLYHESSSTLAKQYFTDTTGVVANLAANQAVQQQLATGQSAALNATLEQQRTIGEQFDSLVMLSAQGKVVASSSNKSGITLGADNSQSAGFLAGKDAPGAVLVPAHLGPLNRIILSVVSPVHDKHGTFLGVTIGALTLDTLTKHMHLVSEYNNSLSSLLTDSQGNALVSQNRPAKGLVNLKDKEPALGALMHQQTVPANEEYSFNQKKTLTQGSQLNIGDAGNLYVVSFYDLSDYQTHLDDATQNLNTAFASFIIRNFLLVLGALLVIGMVIKVHENRAS
jgi:Cache domain